MERFVLTSIMKSNLGTIDRAVRIVLALALFSLFLIIQGNLRWIGLIGLVPLVTGLAGICPIYTMIGINTRKVANN